MFADFSHSPSPSLANRLAAVIWRLSHAFETAQSNHLPAELGRLSDHLLRDVGVEPRQVRNAAQEPVVNLELLQREWP